MRVILPFLFLLISLPGFAQRSSLVVVFKGIEPRQGKVMVDLRDADGTSLRKEVVDIPATGSISHTFRDLNNGIYTMACYHDRNGNQKLDKNFMGVPTETYGFSNDARGTFGPPDLEDQRFEVSGTTRIEVKLE